MFGELPQEEPKPTRLNKKEKFLYALPHTFNRQKYLEVAKAMNIPAKTVEGYIANFVKSGFIHREAHDQYINTTLEENKEVKDSSDLRDMPLLLPQFRPLLIKDNRISDQSQDSKEVKTY